MAPIVTPFTGITRGPVSPDKVLDAAKDAALTDVLVVGLDADGALYAASSTGDDRTEVYLAHRFLHCLLSGEW